MKTEERHRLHEHELQKLTRQAGEFWTQHGTKVLISLAAVVVVAVGIVWWVAGSQSGAAAGWTAYAGSTSAEKFSAVAEDYSGQPVGWWSRLRAAEIHLDQAVQQSFSDRPAARDELGEALDALDALLNSGSLPDRLHERALYAYARALETQAAIGADDQEAASLAESVAAYQKLLDSYPETVFKELAEQRVAALDAERTREFVAWFSRQTPKPEDRPLPQDGLPAGDAPELSEKPVTLPDVPSRLQFPLTDDGTASSTGSSESPDGTTAPPFPDSAVPDDEPSKPGDDPPPTSVPGDAAEAATPTPDP